MVAVQTRNRQMPKISRVKLLKKIKISTSAGATWTLVPALFDSKGRVRRDHVTVAGQDEVHAEGSYYLEWWEGGKRYREAAGPNGFAAADKCGLSRPHWTPRATGLFRYRRRRSGPGSHDPKTRPRCVQRLRSLSPIIANLPYLPSHPR